MRIDWSAAELFLSYVDGDVPLSRVWDHPAYDVARDHAALLDRDLTREDVSRAMAGEETPFSGVETLADDRDRVERLLDHVRSHESEWTERIDRQLDRVVPGADVSDVTLHLAIGYEFGVGVERGAYVNLNEPLFFRMPRQLLYTALHESSHVLYEREHHSMREFGSKPMQSRPVQWRVFNTICHTEAYATYTPLELRAADGNLGVCDHPMCEDYRVLEDDARVGELVDQYDSFRETLREESVPRETLFARLFGEPRLPYRVGCALLEGLEEKDGMEAVRDAFHADPVAFCEEYDWILDEYRT